MKYLGKKNPQTTEKIKNQVLIQAQNPKSHYLRWNYQQNVAYANFLKTNIKFFNGETSLKMGKIFVRMANQLKNGRNNHQCRSHHVKLLKRFKSVKKIIEGIQNFSSQNSVLKEQDLFVQIQKLVNTTKKSELLMIMEENIMEQSKELFDILSGPSFSFYA